jgi:hypothetical protein
MEWTTSFNSREVGGCSTAKSASKGKEKVVSDKGLADFIKKHFPREQEGSPMECNARPPNTTVKRRQLSNQTMMVEVTQSQGKEIVASLNKMHEISDKRATSHERLHEK